jgi:hypothetical protein
MRYKIGNRWIKATTKQKDLEKAKKIANDIYLRAKFREDEGLPIISKRFDAVARIVKNKLQAALDRRVSRILCKRRLITAEAFFPQTE